MESLEARSQHEIEHGRFLASSGNPELIWKWDTPAGRVRAQRRGGLIAEAAGLQPGMRALEIGCGSGLFTEIMTRWGANILAVDISPELLEFARKRKLPSPQIEFREMRFEDADVEGLFDAVVGSSILHHLEMSAALRRIYKLLKSGGRMAFAEPNMLNPQIWMERNVDSVRQRVGASPDETAIVRWRLARELEQIGFTDVRIRNIDWLHPATPAPLISLVSSVGVALEQIPLLREFSGSVLISAVKAP